MLFSWTHQVSPQRSLKLLHPHRHLHAIERVLHDIVPIQLIAPPHHHIRIWLFGAREEQELDPRWRLETRQAEMAGLDALDARGPALAIERVLHDIVPIQLIAPPHHHIRIWLFGAREEQELDPRWRLETRQAEMAGLDALDARGLRLPRSRDLRLRRGRVDRA
nr:hypothetical protein CFP56_22432 [Quercus suber]